MNLLTHTQTDREDLMKTLTFETTINAPRSHVWQTMLGDEGYRYWTSIFYEGSHYSGSWDEGADIRFLAPTGDGMVARIAANRPFEYISIRMLGMITNGVVDTTSDAVRAWAPSHENYSFEDVPGGCHLVVTMDSVPDWEEFMLETYPKALARLKELCER